MFVLVIVFWIQLKNKVAAKARANNEVEETHIRVETLADSLSACQWMDEHISYCRENRIHCDEDKQCCCEKCDEARYLKNDLTQCNICDGVRGYYYRRNIKDHCAECDQDPYAMRTDPDGQLITVAGEPTGIYRRDNDQTFHEEAVRYFEFVLGDK
jgi:hypothetical protein